MDPKIRDVFDRGREGLPALDRGEGWQCARDLHELPELSDRSECVLRACRGVMRFLNVGPEACEITGCWINVLAPGASHAIHAHPNAPNDSAELRISVSVNVMFSAFTENLSTPRW